MSAPSGYVDSQTWQAWYEALLVVCGNTSLFFLSLVLVAAAAVAYVASLPTDSAGDNQDKARRRTKSLLREAEEMEGENKQEEQADQVVRQRKTVDHETPTEYKAAREGETSSVGDLPSTEGRRPSRQEVLKAREGISLTPQDQQKERQVTSEQLVEIFSVMKQNEDKFGATSLEDLAEQMQLYAS